MGHHGHAGDLDLVHNFQMAGNAHCAGHDAITTNTGTAGNTSACGNGRVRPNTYVVSDVNLVIENDALFNHGIVHRTTINGGAGTDHHIIPNPHASQWGDPFPTARLVGKTETIRADHRATVHNDPLSEHHPRIEADIGMQVTVVTDQAVLTHVDIGN